MSMIGRIVNYRHLVRISTGKNHQLWAPTRKAIYRISYKKSTISTIQPMRNCHHPERLLLSNGLLFKQPLPTSFPFSIKCSSPFFVAHAYGFCCSLFILDSNSSLFLNKPISAGKMIGIFIFKVNST